MLVLPTNLLTFTLVIFPPRVNVLNHKDSIEDGIGLPDLKLLGCLAACYVILFLTMWKGVESSGKVAYFTALFPYAVLITLLVKGCTLEGSIDGILYFITPQWSALLDIKVKSLSITNKIATLRDLSILTSSPK